MRKLDPVKHVGDGKLPNYYWVFGDDTKFKRVKSDFGNCLEPIKEYNDGEFLGQFETYEEALKCVDDNFYPHITIEDRLSGPVFEQTCVVCQDCGREDWESWHDIKFTKEKMEKAGKEFK